MSDQSAIAIKLAALAAKDCPFTDGQRVINHDLPPLPAILREIDDTVLERTLVFSIGAATVHAVAAGRRLRGIVQISGDAPGKDRVVGVVLSQEDGETLGAVGAILTHLCASAPTITVRSDAVRPLGSSAEAGVSTTVLANAWGVDLDAKPLPPLSRFLTANAAHIIASFYVADGQSPQTTGDAIALQAIWDVQVIPFRKRHKSVVGKLEGPMLICLEGALDGQPLAMAVTGAEQCLFSYRAAGLTDLLASWNAVTRA